MNILILGAGRTGGALAEQLASEDFDVTVVDSDGRRLSELRERLDIQTVQGHASQPDVLRQAGAEDADMLIAVTSSDEVNMVACQVCYSVFRTHQKIARIRSTAYTEKSNGGGKGNEFFTADHMPIDVIVNPEHLVTAHIRRLLDHPGALQVLDFCNGRLQLVTVPVLRGDILEGRSLDAIGERLPGIHVYPAAMFRDGQPLADPDGVAAEPGDEVCLLGEPSQLARALEAIRGAPRARRVLIAGGGNIGFQLAGEIAADYDVRVIEFRGDRADFISKHLDGAMVIHGDATDRDLLVDENIERVDAFCALTDDNEVNIMSALLAKRLGARQAMSLIAKPAYVDLVHGGEIDVAISPQLATASAILTHVRRGHVERVHRLRRGAAEAMEVVAEGEARYSRVVGRRLDSLRLPPGTTVGAVLHHDEVLLGAADHVLEQGDHVILILTDRRRVSAVETLFGVGLGFF